MKALSIRQPWAWLIVRPDLTNELARARAYGSGAMKDIENRVWNTRQRGQILIHASASNTFNDYMLARDFIASSPTLRALGIEMPARDELQRGGIIGVADLVDCTRNTNSPWYMGHVGLKLANARPLPFTPFKGSLKFFDVPDEVLEGLETA